MKLKRKFVPGEEWLYYKFFLGKFSSNKFICNCLYPMSKEFITAQLCSNWFYIKYNDPDYHIRYRLKLNDVNNIGIVIHTVQNKIQSYLSNDIIWKVQLDTYERELERYTVENILVSEGMFQLNSELCSELLILFDDEEKLVQSTISILLLLFKTLRTSKIDSHQFIIKNKNAHKNEHKPSKIAEDLLHQKFIDFNAQADTISLELFSNEVIDRLVKTYISLMADVIGTINQTMISEQFLSSHIHMFINRLFTEKQRLYEMIIYDLIEKYYFNNKSHRGAKDITMSNREN